MRRLVTALLTLALSATLAPPASAAESILVFDDFSGPATITGVLGEYSVTAEPLLDSEDGVVWVNKTLGPGRLITVQWTGLHAHVSAEAVVTVFAGGDSFSSPRLGVGPFVNQLTVVTTGAVQSRRVGLKIHPVPNNVGGASAIQIISFTIS